MPENAFQNNLEAEIAQLSAEIAQKKEALEKTRGFVSEKEILRETVREKIFPAPSARMTPAAPPAGTAASSVSSDDRNKVGQLVNKALSDGLAAAIKEAREGSPYVLDAFHDALVDKLHEELVKRKIIKTE
ncbi:MAG: hypothetical protein HZA37_00580 [Parcubacteria group bacterium]|nr:hypothetical protein [Parcubacteria group bacterium]